MQALCRSRTWVVENDFCLQLLLSQGTQTDAVYTTCLRNTASECPAHSFGAPGTRRPRRKTAATKSATPAHQSQHECHPWPDRRARNANYILSVSTYSSMRCKCTSSWKLWHLDQACLDPTASTAYTPCQAGRAHQAKGARRKRAILIYDHLKS
jgi:hypothetical protein